MGTAELDPVVKCRPDGLHIAASPRLWIVADRLDDVVRSRMLASEPEAQKWLGWRSEDLLARSASMVIPSLTHPVAMVPRELRLLHFAGVDRETSTMVGGITVELGKDPVELGGVIDVGRRGQKFGTELLRTVRIIAHRHYGIARLIAGCEASNEAGKAWLARSGLTRIDGPPTHTLPNGREIQATWWESTDPYATIACRNLLPPKPSWRRIFSRSTTGRTRSG